MFTFTQTSNYEKHFVLQYLVVILKYDFELFTGDLQWLILQVTLLLQ